MRRTLVLLLGGLVCLTHVPFVGGQDRDLGIHDFSGPVQLLWDYPHALSISDAASLGSIAVSPDGTKVFLTTDWYIFAHDASTGRPLWVSYVWVYEPVANSVAVSPSGATVFTAAVQRIVDHPDRTLLVTQAFDAATGIPRWKDIRQFPHVATEGWAGGVSVAVSPDGTAAFVAGFAEGTAPWTIAFETATGQILWTGRGSGGDAIVTSPDGGAVFVSGDRTLALDATTGAEIWDAEAGGLSIATSPHGSSVFVTSEDRTVALDVAAGDQLWCDRENGADVVTSPDGSLVFVTGDTKTVAYAASTGERIWMTRFGLDQGFGKAASLAMSPDGGALIVTGVADGLSTGEDYATVGYDATTGREIWTARYDGPVSGDDLSRSIVLSPDGTAVFVLGESEGVGTDHESTTIAYEPMWRHGVPLARE